MITALKTKPAFKVDRLKKGNKKLHNVYVFDLPAIASCLNCASCKTTCYAMKAQRQYPCVRNWRDTNHDLAKNDIGYLESLLCKQLQKIMKKDSQVVRIHSSGDFFNQTYVDMWAYIIAIHPNINFYAYTKVEKILDFKKIEALNNFNLISSFIDGKLNYGTLEYVQKLERDHGAFICPATVGKDIKCNRECSYCTTEKRPVFVIH